jgi:DNA polymerase-3 subunit delta
MSQAEIASIFNVSAGRAYYMMKNAKSSNLKKIQENLDYLNQLDANIKSGVIKEDLGLELFFLR